MTKNKKTIFKGELGYGTKKIAFDDMKKTKVKWEDAVKVYKGLMSLKTPIRSKYLRILQKDAKSFKKVFDAVLKVSK